jgi:hypothetical protein
MAVLRDNSARGKYRLLLGKYGSDSDSVPIQASSYASDESV